MAEKKQSPEVKATLSPEALEARRAYRRKWTRENPDKVRAYTAAYWERVAKMRRTPPAMRIERADIPMDNIEVRKESSQERLYRDLGIETR